MLAWRCYDISRSEVTRLFRLDNARRTAPPSDQALKTYPRQRRTAPKQEPGNSPRRPTPGTLVKDILILPGRNRLAFSHDGRLAKEAFHAIVWKTKNLCAPRSTTNDSSNSNIGLVVAHGRRTAIGRS